MNRILHSVQQGIRYPGRYIGGRKKSAANIDSIAAGHGAIIDHNGQKVAVYKSDSGEISAHSAVCTHMGCIVGWDDSAKQWQCPCHGSQYNKAGKVVHGPAKRDLPVAELPVKT